MRENDWVNKNVDLLMLSERVQQFFYDDGFSEVKVDEDPNGTWFELQAKKMGALRTIVSSRKAIHVIIKGEPNKFTVSIGTGEWGKNFVVAGVFTGGIGLVGMGLNLRFTNKVWNFIKETIDSLENSYTGATKSTRKKGTSKSTRKKERQNLQGKKERQNLQGKKERQNLAVNVELLLSPHQSFVANVAAQLHNHYYREKPNRNYWN